MNDAKEVVPVSDKPPTYKKMRYVRYSGDTAVSNLNEIADKFGISLNEPFREHRDPVLSTGMLITTRIYECSDHTHFVFTCDVSPLASGQPSTQPSDFSVTIYEVYTSTQRAILLEEED